MQACFTIFLCFKMLSIGAFFGFLNFDWSLSASLSVEFRTHIACSRTVHCNIIDGSLFFFCISLLLFPPHPSKRKKKNQFCLITPCSWIFYFSLGFHVITGYTLWYLWGCRVWQRSLCHKCHEGAEHTYCMHPDEQSELEANWKFVKIGHVKSACRGKVLTN